MSVPALGGLDELRELVAHDLRAADEITQDTLVHEPPKNTGSSLVRISCRLARLATCCLMLSSVSRRLPVGADHRVMSVVDLIRHEPLPMSDRHRSMTESKQQHGYVHGEPGNWPERRDQERLSLSSGTGGSFLRRMPARRRCAIKRA